MTSSPAVSRGLSVLTTPTERDQQRRVGPSELGDMCQLCLAEKLLGVHADKREGTPLAPLFGTAMHAYLEYQSYIDNLTHGVEDILLEHRVDVGEVPGYGTINGTMDRFDIKYGHGIDWKCLSVKKAKDFRSCHMFRTDGELVTDDSDRSSSTLRKYWHQLQLYGKGMEDEGYTVNDLSIVILPRDATTQTVENGIVEIKFEYIRDVAQRVLDRAGAIYEWASSHPDRLTELDSDPWCYYCNFNR